MAVESFHSDGQTNGNYQTNNFHNPGKAANKKKRAYWNSSAGFLLRREERTHRGTNCEEGVEKQHSAISSQMAHSMKQPTDSTKAFFTFYIQFSLTAQMQINPLNPELNPI